jgi:pyruvate dehydrogenase E2 component (dihydrolipoamide acetyltransferase)
MPALSPTMTEGRLARWLKSEGDMVRAGEALCEIETDKATMEVEAADDGILARILVAGDTPEVAVNTPIALLCAPGEDVSRVTLASSPSQPFASVPPSLPRKSDQGADAAALSPPGGREGGLFPPPQGGERVFASPLAKRIAKEGGVDLKTVRGSGPHGRIVKADIEAAIKATPTPTPTPAPASTAPFEPAFEELPNSTMRKVIARRLAEAKATIPHFYLSVDVELDALLDIRADLNGRSDAYKLSVNDFVVRAVALALRKVPAANASWGEDAVKRYTDIDISVAVATPNGLITPIVHHADRKGLAEISNEMKSLAAKARDNKLKPEEFQGGGFTISNLGMHGIKEFAAIINPPQGCILAVGAGEQRPVVKSGALAIATVMTVTLSVDHRVVDGAVGAEFLAAFKTLIEEPLVMLL